MEFRASDHTGPTAWPAHWQRPQWPALAKVRAFCTSRAGGLSGAPYDSMNLGQHVGDRREAVAANRLKLQQVLGVQAVFLNQVHGCDVVALPHGGADGVPADGSWTSARGLACTVLVADCLPLLLCTTDGSRVAALHAGWRGLAGVPAPGAAEPETGVIETFLRDQASLGVAPSNWIAWLGPCIGPQAFEVGNEVRQAFFPGSPSAALAFVPHGAGKWLADLALLARQRLHAAGVTGVYGNDSSARWCTVGNPLSFFSHRRDRVSGRFAAGVWLV
ncbi:MAG: peptidoglycan editing factor PgeF [Betaproteobacteria bacterium]